jgi:hypothetical protein
MSSLSGFVYIPLIFYLCRSFLNYSGFAAHNSSRYIISAVSFPEKMHNMKMRQIKAALPHFQKTKVKASVNNLW